MRNLNTNVVLETRKFSCRIAGKRILRDVSLQIRRGEYISAPTAQARPRC